MFEIIPEEETLTFHPVIKKLKFYINLAFMNYNKNIEWK